MYYVRVRTLKSFLMDLIEQTERYSSLKNIFLQQEPHDFHIYDLLIILYERRMYPRWNDSVHKVPIDTFCLYV